VGVGHKQTIATAVDPAPFATSSISLGLYMSDEHPQRSARLLEQQARLAIDAGFDGVTVPEHHGGQAAYPANPILTAVWLLGTLPRGWAAAAPTLPLLRVARCVAEDVAWAYLHAQGRFAAAFAAGYDARDFRACDRDSSDRPRRFRDAVEVIVHHVSHSADDDIALRASAADRPVMLVATRGERAARRAAELGLGLLLPPLPTATARSVVDVYRAAGGDGPVTMSRWVWLGSHPTEGEARLNGRVATAPGDLSWRDDAAVLQVESSTDPSDLAHRVAALALESGATNVNLRVHLPGVTSARTTSQIESLGCGFVDQLRHSLQKVRSTKSTADPQPSNEVPS
jgi:alkanesulfonate monooxygenase SsuD/methylene tetrahydromethanopterin reductase-like flavin-dependent oxidoreductase (luciferase family)